MKTDSCGRGVAASRCVDVVDNVSLVAVRRVYSAMLVYECVCWNDSDRRKSSNQLWRRSACMKFHQMLQSRLISSADVV